MTQAMLVQCELRSDDRIMITWLDMKKPIKIGDKITLKQSSVGFTTDMHREWTVESIGQPTPAKDIHHEWSNNI